MDVSHVLTRWHDLFAYAQAKTELNLTGWLAQPYASMRFVGDTDGATEPGLGFAPQYLSRRGPAIARSRWPRVLGEALPVRQKRGRGPHAT